MLLFFENLPSEILSRIIENLTIRDALNFSETSKQINANVKEELWRKTGATSYQDFLTKVSLLHLNVKIFLLKTPVKRKYQIAILEEASRILQLPREEQIASLVSNEQRQRLSEVRLDLLRSLNGIIALLNKNITPEQARTETLPQAVSLKYLLKDKGLSALEEELITPEQAGKLPPAYLREILTQYGLLTLHKGLLTFKQVLRFGNEKYLQHLFTPNGFYALYTGLITGHDAAILCQDQLYYLLTDHGIQALKEKLIGWKQLLLFNHPHYLKYVFTEEGLNALRTGRITMGKAADMLTVEDLKLHIENPGTVPHSTDETSPSRFSKN